MGIAHLPGSIDGHDPRDWIARDAIVHEGFPDQLSATSEAKFEFDFEGSIAPFRPSEISMSSLFGTRP